MFNPASTTDTWLGNQTFNVAKFAVGGVNWSHYLIADGGELLSPLDDLISTGTTAMYDAVFTTWIGPALLLLAVLMLVLALRGDLAQQAQRGAFAVAALVVGSAAYLAPVDWAKAADPLLLDGVTQMQEGFLGQIGLGNRDTLPTVLVDQVIYQNWQRGEFGSPDVPQAQELGRDLLRAQTFTIDEVAERRDTLELAEQKKADFAAIGERMGDRYPYFTGQVRQPDRRRAPRGRPGAVHRAVPAAVQGARARRDAAAAAAGDDGARDRGGGRAQARHPARAAAGGRRRDRQHARRRRARRPARAARRLAVPARVRHRPVARPARHRRGHGGAVGGGAAVPQARVDGLADARAVRRHRARAPAPARCRGSGSACAAVPRTTGSPAGGTSGAAPPRAPTTPTAARPESEPGGRVTAQATRVGAAPHRGRGPAVPDSRARRAPSRPAVGPGRVGDAGGRPSWSDSGEVDERVIYRRPDAVPLRPGGARPVQAELVDGVPVYRIYRPRSAQTAYSPAWQADADQVAARAGRRLPGVWQWPLRSPARLAVTVAVVVAVAVGVSAASAALRDPQDSPGLAGSSSATSTRPLRPADRHGSVGPVRSGAHRAAAGAGADPADAPPVAGPGGGAERGGALVRGLGPARRRAPPRSSGSTACAPPPPRSTSGCSRRRPRQHPRHPRHR